MLSIDIDGIEGKFKPAINNSIKYLESAQSVVSSIVIPSDFTYRSRLRTLSQNIINIDSRVTNIKNWVNSSISNFNKAERKNNNVFSSITNSYSLSGFNTINKFNNISKKKRRH